MEQCRFTQVFKDGISPHSTLPRLVKKPRLPKQEGLRTNELPHLNPGTVSSYEILHTLVGTLVALAEINFMLGRRC
jgi:hypothetical protein